MEPINKLYHTWTKQWLVKLHMMPKNGRTKKNYSLIHSWNKVYSETIWWIDKKIS